MGKMSHLRGVRPPAMQPSRLAAFYRTTWSECVAPEIEPLRR